MRLLIAITIALSVPATVHAEDAKPANPDKKTCRTQEAVGTMFSKRICHTKAEWAKIDEQTRNDARDFDENRRNRPDLPR